MKYLLLLLAFILCGCVSQREKEMSDMSFRKSIDILRLQHELAMYKEPENTVRPFVLRKYKQEDGSALEIAIPADGILGSELEFKFRNAKQTVVCDVSYWLPSKDFLITKLLPTFRSSNFVPYSNKFDCDDFSRFFALFSQTFYTRVVINKGMEGIAIGEVHYLKKSPPLLNLTIAGKVLEVPFFEYSKHAINCVVLDDLSILFIEPQSGQEIQLSDEELKSIYYVRF